MAFTINISGNLAYIKETATYSTGKAIRQANTRIIGIIITPNHATNPALIELAHNNSGRSYPTVNTLTVPVAFPSQYYGLDKTPMVFPEGIYIKAVEYADITLILDNNSQR